MQYARRGLKSLSAAAALLVCTATAASPFHLLVTDHGLPALPLYVAVYPASAGSWDAEPVALLRHSLPETDNADIELDLPPGDYAIRAFVDLDGNGKLDLNRRGHPAEPYASSLSPERSRRSQRFEHAIISLSEDHPRVSIELTYPRERGD